MDKVKKMTPGNKQEAHEAEEALLDAIDSARKAIRRAEGGPCPTHRHK